MKTALSQSCAERVLSCHTTLARLRCVLSETVDPLFRTIGGGASFGVAVLCAFEASRKEPRWDRAAGLGAALGAVIGGGILLYDTIQAW